MKFNIYTDGCCVPNPGLGSWAYIKLNLNFEVVSQGSGTFPDTTNNRMEYEAVLKAIESCEIDDEIEIYSDSQLLVSTFNQWMEKWESFGWKRKMNSKNNDPIKNVDLVQRLLLLKKLYKNVKVVWVKGHNGNKYNEMADQLCLSALSRFSISRSI